MIKKFLALALCCAIFLTAATCFAEQTQSYTLQGLITGVSDAHFLLHDQTNGIVQVNLDDERTAYAGVAAKDQMAVGQYVFVQYNGIMTKSIPPQVTADKVSCYVIHGTVSEILQSGYVVQGDSVLGTVIVHMDKTLAPIFLNVPITVYYSGIIALSMPPQLAALHTVVPMLEGVASSVTDTGLILTDEHHVVHHITLDAQTQVDEPVSDGLRLCVYYNGTLENTTDAVALKVTGAISGDPAEAETTQQ